MDPSTLKLIQEIYYLWEPVYPYLAEHILEHYDRQDGNILEIGPFCGVLCTLLEMKIGTSHSIAAFPSEMVHFFREETRKRGIEEKVKIIEADPSLGRLEENHFDLAVFRGAFFFPSLFKVSLSQIYRILGAGGVALVGGGFGKFTPDSIIKDIGNRSRDLNLQIGRIEIRKEDLQQEVQTLSGKAKIDLISEGGLWVSMKK